MRLIIIVLFTILSPSCFALFCPTNFSNISLGDSLEQVLSQCGQPVAKNVYNKQEGAAQKWEYYIKTHPHDLTDKTTRKMIVVMNGGKAVDITVTDDNTANAELCKIAMMMGSPDKIKLACAFASPQSIGTTNICGGQMIKVGDSAQTIENACGKPSFITQGQASPSNGPELTELIYNGPPPVTLLFENHRLVDRRFT